MWNNLVYSFENSQVPGVGGGVGEGDFGLHLTKSDSLNKFYGTKDLFLGGFISFSGLLLFIMKIFHQRVASRIPLVSIKKKAGLYYSV